MVKKIKYKTISIKKYNAMKKLGYINKGRDTPTRGKKKVVKKSGYNKYGVRIYHKSPVGYVNFVDYVSRDGLVRRGYSVRAGYNPHHSKKIKVIFYKKKPVKKRRKK